MSEDEVLVLVLSAVVAVVGWATWAMGLSGVRRTGRPGGGLGPLMAAPALCLAVLVGVLLTLAASEVREAPEYLTLYALLGMGWLAVLARVFTLLGVSARDDVAERRNPAAALALGGALVGLTLCFAGANIGEGPGWWVVVYSASLATLGFFLAWALVEWLYGVSDVVTVDRDGAAGLRFGAWCVAIGLVLGRSVAGDWSSAMETARDAVRVAWPVPLLAAAEGVLGRVLAPTAARPRADLVLAGVLPGTAWLAAAAAYVLLAGRW
ncbi:MAG: hypothetical protein HY722_16150 [Planctomycetes bacterium]|nr:hypothetical protein [Planctomycetota bacterium]